MGILQAHVLVVSCLYNFECLSNFMDCLWEIIIFNGTKKGNEQKVILTTIAGGRLTGQCHCFVNVCLLAEKSQENENKRGNFYFAG